MRCPVCRCDLRRGAVKETPTGTEERWVCANKKCAKYQKVVFTQHKAKN